MKNSKQTQLKHKKQQKGEKQQTQVMETQSKAKSLEEKPQTKAINPKEETRIKPNSILKETMGEFSKSLLIGAVPVGLDYFFSALIIFLLSLKSLGYSFADTFFIDSGTVKASTMAIATSVGYLAGFIASYLFSVFFVFKHNKKGKSLKGIFLFIGVEAFIYGFNILLGTFLPRILSYTWAFLVRIAVSYIVVFILRKFLIFMPEKKQG